MADPKHASKPADAETITDRIMAAAEEAHLKVKADPKAEEAAGKKPVEEIDPKARVEGLFSAVSAELSGAAGDTDKLKELQSALQSRAGMLSRAVESAIEDAIAMANQEAAEKAAAEPPPAQPVPASAHPVPKANEDHSKKK